MSIVRNIPKKIFDLLGFQITRKKLDILDWLATRQIKTILDVGANKGQFAREIRQLFPYATLHCFEPLAGEYEQLQKNLSLYPNCFQHRMALGNENGETIINRNEFSASSSLLPISERHLDSFPYAKNTLEERISIRRLDDIFDSLQPKPNIVLKIDVQGFEDAVLDGAKKSLKNICAIIIEVSYLELYKGQKLSREIITRLQASGFMHIGDLLYANDPSTGLRLQGDAVLIRDSFYR
jgi:FkbM family methyltransferase